MSKRIELQHLQEENNNLLSFILDIYNDKKYFRENVGLLNACILEWHNNNLLL